MDYRLNNMGQLFFHAYPFEDLNSTILQFISDHVNQAYFFRMQYWKRENNLIFLMYAILNEGKK